MSPEAQVYVVKSFNIRGWSKEEKNRNNAWDRRAQLNGAVVASNPSDTLGLQEYDKRMNEGVYAKYLPGMEHITGPECVPDRYNPIYWKSSRLTLVEQGGFWLSDTPDQKSIGWGSSEERAATMALFRDLQSGREFLQVNAHLEVFKDRARIESAKLILQRIERYKSAGMPIVVTGDLNASHYLAPNAVYTSTPHDLFTERGFADAYLTAHPNDEKVPNSFHNFEGPKYDVDEFGTWLIDHILHSGFKQDSYEIIRDCREEEPKYASDHYQVMARLAIV